ncbi:hypothetical protein BDZ89DRAFT_1068307 [Hymenopellis radicata]|nr:hypothetical protein BDZ89DRAFT_1068307 [Hymenopellis radicata]
MDAALYALDPPKVTALYGVKVPEGPAQTVRYDDGTGDELRVPLAEDRCRTSTAKYAPHPFEWMGRRKARSTAEKSLEELSPWKEEEIKVYPFTWKNPVTGDLHLMVHGWAILEVKDDMLYPNGAHLTDLKEVRELCYRIQRPSIAPKRTQEKDLMLWNNRGLMHTVVGHFTKDQVRLFHQCNLAASDAPLGPSEEDVRAVHAGIDEGWELV